MAQQKIKKLIKFDSNPVISNLFREIGRADELGSGMRNMMRLSKIFGGSDPELVEGDVFRTIIRTDGGAVNDKADNQTVAWAQSNDILEILRRKPLLQMNWLIN